MLIRYKIIGLFIFFVSLVLLLFSFFVYFSFKQYRKNSLEHRLEKRALATRELISADGKILGTMAHTLPEQVDFIYSASDSLVYTNNPKNDFIPTKTFLDSVRKKQIFYFTYPSPLHSFPKEGVAVSYQVPGNDSKNYVALVTAYDSEGYGRLYSLRDLFIYGNTLFILLISVLAYIFAIRTLSPLNSLLKQIKSRQHATLSFRLTDFNEKDEIGIIATAFNELLDQQKRLIDNQRAFISQASHELRTPMTSLKGLLETSILYDKDSNALRGSIQKAARELDRLVSLSNGLLQLARVENEEDAMKTHQLDLMELTMDSVEAVQNAWPLVHMTLQISDGVLQQNRVLLIQGERTLLKIAVSNLIDNACKYADGNPVAIFLEMNTEDKIGIRIADQGIGIPEEDQEKILLPLSRGSNVQTAKGFGIGLTLAYKIIELHQGRFRMKSELGKGTEIGIEFDLIPLNREISES